MAFHDQLLPVCLPPALKEIKPGTHCTVIGWGKREDKNGKDNVLIIIYGGEVLHLSNLSW